MIALPLKTEVIFSHGPVVSQVHYEWGKLCITLVSGLDRKVCKISFSGVLGFRVLDEGDLLEFWPECSGKNGWIFKIISGGWFDQESRRSGFIHAHTFSGIEYFVATGNECISVLSENGEIGLELFAI